MRIASLRKREQPPADLSNAEEAYRLYEAVAAVGRMGTSRAKVRKGAAAQLAPAFEALRVNLKADLSALSARVGQVVVDRPSSQRAFQQLERGLDAAFAQVDRCQLSLREAKELPQVLVAVTELKQAAYAVFREARLTAAGVESSLKRASVVDACELDLRGFGSDAFDRLSKALDDPMLFETLR